MSSEITYFLFWHYARRRPAGGPVGVQRTECSANRRDSHKPHDPRFVESRFLAYNRTMIKFEKQPEARLAHLSIDHFFQLSESARRLRRMCECGGRRLDRRRAPGAAPIERRRSPERSPKLNNEGTDTVIANSHGRIRHRTTFSHLFECRLHAGYGAPFDERHFGFFAKVPGKTSF